MKAAGEEEVAAAAFERGDGRGADYSVTLRIRSDPIRSNSTRLDGKDLAGAIDLVIKVVQPVPISIRHRTEFQPSFLLTVNFGRGPL